jgi:hypothetical protein
MKTSRTLAVASLGLALIGLYTLPVEARSAFGNAQVQSITQSNFATRQAQLRSEINTKVSSGQLSTAAAASLLGQLDQINAQVQSDLASVGAIDNVEANRIVAMFGSVTDQLNSSTVSSPYNPYINTYANPYVNPYASPYTQRNLMLQQRQLGTRYPSWMY